MPWRRSSAASRRPATSCRSRRLSGLQEKVLHEPESFSTLLQYLTVQVSDMFRDPEFFAALRTQGAAACSRPIRPSSCGCAGCSAGEEAYSLAILLQEEGLLDRSIDLRDRHQCAGAARGARRACTSSRGCAASPRTIAARAARRSLSDYYHAGAASRRSWIRRCAARSRSPITAWPRTTCSPKCISSPAATCSSISIPRCRTARCGCSTMRW